MAFPTSVPSNTDPTAGNTQNSPSHAQLHQSHNAEIVAIETKIGTGASTPAANKILYATGTGTSAWQGLTSAQLSALISDETGTGSVVFGTAPTISAPVVSTGTFASPVLTTPAVVTSINDANGNAVIKTPATAAAVNQVTITNAATGNSPRIAASGGDAAAHLNLRGLGLAKTVTIGAGAVNIFPYDYVASGCVITADAAASTLNFSMTSGIVVISGNPVTVASFSAAAATASRDTYVDVLDNGDGTGLVVKTGGNIVTNNAASPVLASNSVRMGIVVSGATNIAAASSINQGQEDRLLPIASSVAYTTTDSLGNLICPRDPNRRILGYAQRVSTFDALTNALTDITGLQTSVMVPTGRRIRISAPMNIYESGTVRRCDLVIREGSTTLTQSSSYPPAASNPMAVTPVYYATPTAGLHTYKLSIQCTAGANVSVESSTASPIFIMVELV